jgi:CBS domain-containing protein
MTRRSIREIIAQRDILLVSQDMTVRDAVRRMTRENYGSVLVELDGQFVGIFTERDALSRVLADGRNPETTLLHEVMTRNPIAVHPDRPLVNALHMMYQYGFRHVPVVEDGKPIGVVSVRDALGAELSQFENELRELEQVHAKL